jgi:hypothetical protein
MLDDGFQRHNLKDGGAMLIVEHRAFHLYREDAYREYCWSVDAYGAYQPASFIYLCFEAFRDACTEYGLQLVYRSADTMQQHFPWRFERDSVSEKAPHRGLILRIEGDEDVAAATEALHEGRNVIALIPSELLGLFYPKDDARMEKAKANIAKIGANPRDWEFRSLANPWIPVSWVEIETDMPGRLFVTRDAFLSDGYFMKGYGYSDDNLAQIKALIQAFACFKSNLLRMSYRNTVNSWPTGEPLTVLVDVWNHGPDLTQALITLNIGREFEPLSPLDRKIPPLRSLERASFALQVVPRVDGDMSLMIGATASLPEGRSCQVVFAPLRLSIVPAVGSSQRSSAPEDDPTLKRLVAVFRDAQMLSEVESLPELVRVDTRACLNRIRILTERIVLQVLNKCSITCRDKNLAAGIATLRDEHMVSDRAVSYLHTIRVIGNIASHAASEPLSEADVRIVSYALACVVEEFRDRRLL